MAERYTGGCQCGAVRFEVTMEAGEATACNCSRCGRLGTLLAFAPADAFTLLSGEGSLTEYRFNNQVIAHLFCKTCGVQSFSRGKGPDGSDMVAINVRCLDGVEPADITVVQFDGRSL